MTGGPIGRLDPGLLSEIFERQVSPYVFDGYPSSTSPRLVLVGAQPGAGKSYTIATIMRADQDGDLVAVTGDALRPFSLGIAKESRDVA